MKRRICVVLAALLACLLAGPVGSALAGGDEAIRSLSRDDLMNILVGCAILGTGGGGSLDEGIGRIDEALAAGKQFRLADIDALDPDTLIGVPYSVGDVSPQTEANAQEYARTTRPEENMYLRNLEQLERYLGRKVSAVICTELGGDNTAIAFYVAAMTDSLIVDGDPAGRSVPGLQDSTFYLKQIPICPMAVMNESGDGAIFTSVADDEHAEALVRALTIVSRGLMAVVDHVNTASVLSDAMIHGSISQAERIGRAFREARDSGGDYVAAVLEAGQGREMFRGVVTDSHYETRDGYTYGETALEGEGDWAGHSLRISYQNENIISWLDGEPYVTVPDLICCFNLDGAEPRLNPEAKVGEHEAVIALPAPAEWTTPEGLAVFGPRCFGYDVDYTPFC